MPSLDELGLGNEIRGVVCPFCGGSLVRKGKRPLCVDDGYVIPIKEEPSGYTKLNDDDLSWLQEHSHELEPEI